MKKQLAVISVLLTCAVCHAQNTLWGEVSFLEKADYFWSVSRFSDDHEIVGAAIDSASVYYSKAIESGTVREDLLPSVYLRLGYCHAMHGRFTESVCRKHNCRGKGFPRCALHVGRDFDKRGGLQRTDENGVVHERCPSSEKCVRTGICGDGNTC